MPYSSLMANAQNDADLVIAGKFQFIIGSTGIILPFLCLIYTSQTKYLLSSISGHYYTPIHAIFIGTLCCLGICMLSYKGYSRLDNILSSLAGIAALAVGLFPTDIPSKLSDQFENEKGKLVFDYLVLIPVKYAGLVHLVCAISLFVILTIFAGLIFPRHEPMKAWNNAISDHIDDLMIRPLVDFRYIINPKREIKEKSLPEEKGWRNLIYRWCAILMTGSLVLILLQNTLLQQLPVQTMFWGETVMVISFGISWLTKSKRGKAEIWEWIALTCIGISLWVALTFLSGNS